LVKVEVIELLIEILKYEKVGKVGISYG